MTLPSAFENQKISKTPHLGSPKPKGCIAAFSLVELLVVVALMAIIASLAVPLIANTLGSAHTSKNLRNAQMLSALSTSAVAAGYPGQTNVSDWIDILRDGFSVTNIFGDEVAYFKATDLSDQDVEGATNYLVISNSALVYRP